MLAPFSDMSVDHLGSISVLKLPIDLKPDSDPVHSGPHRAGPKVRELQHTAIYRMLEQDVTDPVPTEWTVPIVFAL